LHGREEPERKRLAALALERAVQRGAEVRIQSHHVIAYFRLWHLLVILQQLALLRLEQRAGQRVAALDQGVLLEKRQRGGQLNPQQLEELAVQPLHSHDVASEDAWHGKQRGARDRGGDSCRTTTGRILSRTLRCNFWC